jgi:GT2 family glycosyltransferase
MPRFSIITPVFNTPIEALKRCAQSVFEQTQKDWEWCLADDGSTDNQVLKFLKNISAKDPRIKVVFRDSNGGIVQASNSALDLAIGEFVVLLDHDDELSTDALQIVDEYISDNKDADYLYSDEDKIDQDGLYFDRFSKPKFCPERLRGQNYCSHLSVIRRSLLVQVGYFRDGFDGAQDYDLVLRISEQARQIVHIPKVLYHWRIIEGSTAGTDDAKPYAFISAKKAVEEHCQRLGIDAEVAVDEVGCITLKRKLSSFPLVSIVIPTAGTRKMIWGQSQCLAAMSVRSILEKSSYPNYEVILIHDSVPKLDQELDSLVRDHRVNLVWYAKPFDFSDKCNIGVLSSRGEIIILLNDDTSVITPDWIEELVGYFQDSDVGMTGPMLLLEDGRIQSAGHGNNPAPHNMGAGELADSLGPFRSFRIARETSGITGACAAIPKDLYLELGGMSPVFPHSFNDVDFAFKVLEAGKRIIWTPNARLYHFESLSRDPTVAPKEIRLLRERWGRFFANDDYTYSKK